MCDPGLPANTGRVGPSGSQSPHITFWGCAPRTVSWRLLQHSLGKRPRASCLPGNAQLCQLHVEPEPLIAPKQL